MFIEYIERLRERPHGARRRVALVSAGVSTAVVAMLWVLTLPSSFGSLSIRLDDLSASVGAAELGDVVKENNQGLQQLLNIQETVGGAALPQVVDDAPQVYQNEADPAPPSIVSPQSSGGSVIIATSSTERR